MSWESSFDFKGFYAQLCVLNLQKKPIFQMSKEEITALINCVKAHLRQKCLHCANFRPLHMRSLTGTCGLSGAQITDANEFCRYIYDTVPF